MNNNPGHFFYAKAKKRTISLFWGACLYVLLLGNRDVIYLVEGIPTERRGHRGERSCPMMGLSSDLGVNWVEETLCMHHFGAALSAYHSVYYAAHFFPPQSCVDVSASGDLV